jgi:polyisoprenoid-binding protein YceI
MRCSTLALAAALLLGAFSAVPALSQSAASPAPTADAATWRIDVAHSELSFRVRHLVSRVRGTFTDWEGTITADPANLAGGSVNVEIRTSSITTNHERRDNHLRSDDFFDVEGHPTMTFRSRRVETQGERIRVQGDLTIRGVTRPVVLEGSYLGTVPEATGWLAAREHAGERHTAGPRNSNGEERSMHGWNPTGADSLSLGCLLFHRCCFSRSVALERSPRAFACPSTRGNTHG